jgi:fused signal recognition particle receptor
MFENLKKKLSGFLKKTEKVKESKEKTKTSSSKPKKTTHKSKKSANPISAKSPSKKIQTPSPKEEEKSSFISKLKTKLLTSELKKSDFNKIFEELEITLLENNVALEAVDSIKKTLSEDLVGLPIKKQDIESTILSSLKSAISNLLIEPPNLIKEIKSSLSTFPILFFGINGTGKTTSIAKLAHLLKSKGISVCLAAGDTFRAASIEQLETHAKNLTIPIIKSQYGSDPASVAFDAIKYAEKNKIQVVLIDTAGRMYTASNLIKEMEKIVRVSKPKLKIFVGESITGNDVLDQVKTFNKEIGIDGIILSKSDIDKKSGTILSVSQATNKPIYFLGTGQEYKDLQLFTKKNILKNLGLE